MSDHTTPETTPQLCACGCGQPVPQAKFPSWQRKYISGHQPAAQRPLAERFWEKVDRRGPDDCWLWRGATDRKGYGQIKPGTKRQNLRAHRVAWLLTYGENPPGVLCHRCDTPACCNPSHLFVGTPQDNLADMHAKGRHAHGETSGNAKLTDAQVSEIRARYATENILQRELAHEYGVSLKHIGRIINHDRRK